MMNTITSTNKQINFSANPFQKPENLNQIRKAINTAMPDVVSPRRMYLENGCVINEEIRRADYVLRGMENALKEEFYDFGPSGMLKSLFTYMKIFKTANCKEYSEATDTVLKANGAKNCGIFELWAQKLNGNEKPRQLDHVFNIPEIPQMERNPFAEAFVPPENTHIIDMWLDDGFVGTLEEAAPKFELLGLKSDDRLMIRQYKQEYVPTEADLEAFRKDHPEFLIDLNA